MQYMPLTVFGIIMLAIMTFVIIQHPSLKSDEHEHSDSDHQHDISPSALIILIVPLLIGVLIPVHPLDATAASTTRHERLCAFGRFFANPRVPICSGHAQHSGLDRYIQFN